MAATLGMVNSFGFSNSDHNRTVEILCLFKVIPISFEHATHSDPPQPPLKRGEKDYICGNYLGKRYEESDY